MKREDMKKEHVVRELKEMELRVKILEKSETECKRMEARLRRQKDFLYLVIESLPHPFYVIDASDYTIRIANSATHAGLLSKGITCHALTHRSDKPCGSEGHPCPLEIVKETKKPVTLEHIHYDQQGSPRNVEVYAYPILDPEGNVSEIIESCIDITDRKLAEKRLLINNEKLRSLTSALSLAEERERRRIAIEVHDRVAQNLAFAKMELTKMREWLSSGKGSDTADKIIKLLGETIQDTRALISELGSPILYELGFVPAVQWLTQQTERRRGIDTEFADDGQPKPLSDDIPCYSISGSARVIGQRGQAFQRTSCKGINREKW
jgi:signal transduction histidine kinase